jgi:stalled ribosome rescue protein Dom34
MELLVFFHFLAASLRNTAIHQLQQDKICMQNFNETEDFCHFLSSKTSSELKDEILASVAQYSMYREFIVMGPGIVTSLFVGIFCDRYRKGKKLSLVSTSFAQLFETVLLLINTFYMDIRK